MTLLASLAVHQSRKPSMTGAMTFKAIVVAAGTGTRAGPGAAKQWREVAGKPVVRWSVEAMLGAGAREVLVVVAPGPAKADPTMFTWSRLRPGLRLKPGGPAFVAPSN